MAESVTLGGINYTIPDPGDQPNWATGLTPYLVAIAANVASAPAFMQPVSVTATPQTGISGKTYLVTTSSLAITINLPAPATNMWLIVKDVSGAAATRNITLHRPGSQTIDGTASDKVLSRNFGTWIICSDGTNYFVLNEFPDTGLVNADVATAAAIAYSKLNLATSIVNADIAVGAAIAYSKLNLATSIVNADIAAGAAIAMSKLATLTINLPVITNGSGVLTTETTLAIVRGGTNSSASLANGKVMASSAGAIVESAIGVSSTVFTGLGAGASAGQSVRFEQLKVFQTVAGTFTGGVTTTNTAFVATSTTVTITPTSASNKILIIATGCLGVSRNDQTVYATLARAGSNLGDATSGMADLDTGLAAGSAYQNRGPCSMAFLDSPATTSPTVYAVYFRTANASFTATWGLGTTSIIVMEVG